MTVQKKVAHLILLSTLTAGAAVPMKAQQRWTQTTQTKQTYTPPPPSRAVTRPEPQRETPTYQPPARRQSTPTYQPSSRQEPAPTYQPSSRREPTPSYVPPQNHQSAIFQSGNRTVSGVQHSNATVTSPQVITPKLRRTMSYNSRPGGLRINPEHFASHYGPGHGFQFALWRPDCQTCGFGLFNGEYYFNWNGGNFGVVTPIPTYWALASDYLYVDVGDDGNYYLYDTQYPGMAVQLTFVQNFGDDQAGADQDPGDGSGQ